MRRPVVVISRVVCLITLLDMASAPHAAHAATCNVPSASYPKIQLAVNDSACTSIQLAGNTTFFENVTIPRDVLVMGSDGTVVNGGSNGSVFTINSNTIVRLANLTITNGKAANVGGGIYNSFGAILTLTDSAVISNTAPHGGGIENDGTLALNNTTVSRNVGSIDTGGIENSSPANLVNLSNSTITANVSMSGAGGILNGSVMTVINSTVSGNSANTSGGGIWNSGTLNLVYATIAFNHADADLNGVGTGGGVYSSGGTVNIKNTILDSNAASFCTLIKCYTASNDCGGTLTSQDYNLISNTSSCTMNNLNGTDILNQSAKLGPLANNGGPTQTHALLQASPAIDAGQTANCTDNLGAPLSTDQRGWHRPFGPRCDIGAYERGAFLSLPLLVR